MCMLRESCEGSGDVDRLVWRGEEVRGYRGLSNEELLLKRGAVRSVLDARKTLRRAGRQSVIEVTIGSRGGGEEW